MNRTTGAWLYIMTNRPNGILYVGTTVDLPRRIWEHREGLVDGFTKRYGLHRLVYVEWHETRLAARQRESNIKHWPRAWKVQRILKENLNWDDLYDKLV
jgi:putative endonuclease